MENKSATGVQPRLASPHLAQATLYGLNNSFGKIITSGLELSLGSGRLIPVVKILSNSFSGVTLSPDEWKTFKNDFSRIRLYFEAWGSEAERMCGTRTEFSSYYTLLTSCYQQRAVSFGSINRECNEDRKDSVIGEPLAKRQRTAVYSPCVVLQRPTFEKLVEVSRCVDQHQSFLQNHTDIINQCMDTLVSYCQGELGNNKEISGMSVQAFLASEGASEIFLQHLKTVMMNTNPEFIKSSLERILPELIVLFRGHIADRVLSPLLHE